MAQRLLFQISSALIKARNDGIKQAYLQVYDFAPFEHRDDTAVHVTGFFVHQGNADHCSIRRSRDESAIQITMELPSMDAKAETICQEIQRRMDLLKEIFHRPPEFTPADAADLTLDRGRPFRD